MLWRRIIRGIFIALLTFCVAAWVGSMCCGVTIEHDGNSADRVIIVGARIGYSRITRIVAPFPGWHFTSYSRDIVEWPVWDRRAEYHNIVFTYNHSASRYYFTISLWFPTFLSIALLWLVWRMTRPKHTAKGFPVEVGDQQTKP